MKLPLLKKNCFLALIALCILTFFLYAGMLRYPLLSNDDIDFFTKYPEILSLSWNNALKYFSSYHVTLYQPLTVLSFALNYHFTGTSPLPLHLVNLIFHLINIILVFFIFNRLFNKPVLSLLIAFLFAVHPLNAEAITWVSARSSVMYGCFYLLSVFYYLKYTGDRNQIRYLLLTFVLFILSLFCKVQAVTLPMILFLIDYYSGRKDIKRLFFEKVPFMILSVVFVIIAFRNTETFTFLTHSKLYTYSGIDLVFLNGRALFFYLQKFLVPVELSAVYAFPIKINGWLPVEYYVYTLLFVVLCFFVYRFRKNRKLVFGAGVFLFSIFINLPLISIRSVIVADRYAYLSCLGLALIGADLFHTLAGKYYPTHPKYILTMVLLFILYGSFLSYQTWERNKKWESDLTLSTDIIQKNPSVPFMSKIYRKRANYLAKQGMIRESVLDYSKAIELDPDDIDSYIGRAYSNIKLKNFKEALPDLDKGIAGNPNAAILYGNRAMVRLNTGDDRGALSDCTTCLSLDSANAEAYNYQAILKFRTGDLPGAAERLRKAIRFNNRYPEAYKNLGTVLFHMQDQSQACNYWGIAARLGDRQAVDLMKINCRRR